MRDYESYLDLRGLWAEEEDAREDLDLPHCGDPRCGCPTTRQLNDLILRVNAPREEESDGSPA